MTTIATDGETMAADSSRYRNDTRVAMKAQKMERLPDGSLVGCSGRSVDCDAFRAWLRGGKLNDRPEMESLSALQLMSDGKLLYHSPEGVVDAECPAAVGSGSDIALGAMLAGASPQRAVEIAKERDVYTGGDIVVLGRA